MPQYRLTADAFVDGHRRRKGDVVSFDGPPGSSMVAIDPPTPAKAAPSKSSAKANTDQDA